MLAVKGYAHFGGTNGEIAALHNLLAFHGVRHPLTGQPLSEALCFGIAGGIGAGYSFCPSVVRWGCGSGVSIVGRHLSYATNAAWYQGFCDRIGATTRITETGGKGKAYQNLVAELQAGRPTVVWCSRFRLPFLGGSKEPIDLWMHSFIVYAVDEENGIAYGSDQAPTRVRLTLDELAGTRAGVCSHKNRTLTLDPPGSLSTASLRDAVRAGIQATVKELLDGRIKTFSLPGLEILAKMITNDKNKDGWRKVFAGGLVFSALKDTYNSIATSGTGGDLYRSLYSAFLDEAAALLPGKGLDGLASEYRALGKQWVALADTALPGRVKQLKSIRDVLARKQKLIENGEKGQDQLADTGLILAQLERDARNNPPLGPAEVGELLESMRGQIEDLHRKETEATTRLVAAIK
jgi:hypothetical protein